MSKTIRRAVAAASIVLLSTTAGAGIAGAADRGRHDGRDRHGVVQWNHRRPPRLTTEQRRCLWEQVRTSKPWTLPTAAARVAAWRAALEACGVTVPGGSTTTTTTTTKPPPIEPN
jgi:hypothetical protein